MLHKLRQTLHVVFGNIFQSYKHVQKGDSHPPHCKTTIHIVTLDVGIGRPATWQAVTNLICCFLAGQLHGKLWLPAPCGPCKSRTWTPWWTSTPTWPHFCKKPSTSISRIKPNAHLAKHGKATYAAWMVCMASKFSMQIGSLLCGPHAYPDLQSMHVSCQAGADQVHIRCKSGAHQVHMRSIEYAYQVQPATDTQLECLVQL